MCRNILVLYHFEPPTTVEEVGRVTQRLLDGLQARTATRTREGEQAKARVRSEQREARFRRR